ncbi:MAG: hypothetical protein ACW964_11145 [Candidatus Hodarchaeales archaeon]|jgi:hypothetical protein
MKMDISEIIFTYLAPLLYNVLFISLWILWFYFHQEKQDGRLKGYFRSYLERSNLFYPITGGIIVIFLFLLLDYAAINTDVDDAITSAVQAFLNGSNPYKEDVVVHHVSVDGNLEVVLGRYHYFPPDLLIYSGFYILMGEIFFPILETYWFVPLHFVLLIPGYWLVTRIVYWPHRRLAPFYIMLVTPFLFTNSILMWFFFVLGYYLFELKEQRTLGMVCYVVAASIKYMVGFIIVFYFVKMIKDLYNQGVLFSNYRITLQNITPYIISSLFLTSLSLPFGLIDVVFSVFVYQGITGIRDEVAQSAGPLLIEILKLVSLDQILFVPLALLIALAAFLFLWKYETYEQILHFSFLSMLILPFYATELFISIPFYFWFKEGQKSLERKEEIEKS